VTRRGSWSDERVAILKEWNAKGAAYAAIAERLGVTRNTVVTKLEKLGLIGATSGPKSPKERAGRSARHASGDKVHANAMAMAPLLRRPFGPPPKDPPGAFASLLELPAWACKWPIGDPDLPSFTFCGAPRAGANYCAPHQARSMGSRGND
jgi:GcrA cell cycle regulator